MKMRMKMRMKFNWKLLFIIILLGFSLGAMSSNKPFRVYHHYEGGQTYIIVVTNNGNGIGITKK